MFCLEVNLCTVCMPSNHGGQKKISGTLELELQMVLTNYVGDGNRTQIVWKSNKYSFQ